eukprot:3036130-Amphidinium_carterae.1
MEVHTLLARSVCIRASHGSAHVHQGVEKLCASNSHEPNAVQKSQQSLREWTPKSGNALPNGCEKKGSGVV